MKKKLIITLMFLFTASSAFAFIANSAHDLSSGSAAAIKGTMDELCVYCHTPHGAGAAGTAPLWNRTTISATAFYDNPAGTIDGTMSLAGVNASDAILCLSCHDGASLTTALNNPPNSGGDVPIVQVGAASNLTTDLSNDHPVGFDFATTSADTDLDTKTNIEGSAGMTGALSFGTGDAMWCSSCHDVHGVDDGAGTLIPAFLRISNSGSALCLECHTK